MQDMRDCDSPFGGITVIFGGDFQQILPVIIKGSRAQIVSACLQRLPLWSLITVLKLSKNICLGDDSEERKFAQWQLDVGHGKHTSIEWNITLPDKFKCAENSVKSLMDTIYHDIGDPHDDKYFEEWSILSGRNDDVDDLNRKILKDFPREEIVY